MTAEHAPALFTEASLPATTTGGRRTVAERVADSVPENTRRAYSRVRAEFTEWCRQQGRTALPADGDTLAEYVNHLLNRGRLDRAGMPRVPWQPVSLSTVEQALAAVRTLHRVAGYAGQPATDKARAVIRGEARKRAAGPAAAAAQDGEQALPLLVPAIQQILEATDLTTYKGARDRALLVLGFAGMLRRSELVGLDVGDVAVTDDGLDVRLRTSKTDKESRGVRVPIPRGTHPETDPVRVFEALMAKHRARSVDAPGEPLFLTVDRHGWTHGRMRAADVTAVVRDGCRRAGIPDPDRYSGHSMRAGGATAAYAAGAPIEAIRKQGRWAPGSTAMLAYFRAVDRWKDNPMRAVGL